MDLMENAAFSPPMILLQTVMDEVRHRSLPLYNRLKALSNADDKKIYIFYNDFSACVSDTLAWALGSFHAVIRPSYAKKAKHPTIATTEVRSVILCICDANVLSYPQGDTVVQRASQDPLARRFSLSRRYAVGRQRQPNQG